MLIKKLTQKTKPKNMTELFRKALKALAAAVGLIMLCAQMSAQSVHIGGGYIYNVRENDHGFWLESAAQAKRIELALDWHKMATDPYMYRAVTPLARVRIIKHVSAEAGYEWGAICLHPDVTCAGASASHRTRTPVAGVVLDKDISPRLNFVWRTDFAKWQLAPLRYKDDGLRMLIGLRYRL